MSLQAVADEQPGDAREVPPWPDFAGCLALIGGGEFSFGETLDVDRAWLERTPPGPVAFVPAASGSVDYGRHFAAYLKDAFDREVVTVPIYRTRDARRDRNLQQMKAAAAVYLGGGVADHLLDAIADGPAAEAIAGKLASGGVVVAIAAAAQAAGAVARSVFGGRTLTGLGLLPGLAVEPNFDPGHDRRLRRALAEPGVTWGLGLPAGSAVLTSRGAATAVGTAFVLEDPEGDYRVLGGSPEGSA